jgi:hypothetical protein
MTVYPKPVKLIRLLLLGLLFACGLAACSPNATTVAEAEYPSKIVGNWLGKVGGTIETISFGANGEFVSLVRPGGFISMTLSQGVTATVRGTWMIKGKSITLNISSTEHERVLNSVATATIETLKPNELFVKNSTGVTSTFVRLRS